MRITAGTFDGVHTSLHTSMIVHTSLHTSMIVHTSLHTNMIVHTSLHTSMIVHTSLRFGGFGRNGGFAGFGIRCQPLGTMYSVNMVGQLGMLSGPTMMTLYIGPSG